MKKMRSGFTMVELLSSMLIVSILSGLYINTGKDTLNTTKHFTQEKLEKLAQENFIKEQAEMSMYLEVKEKTFTVDKDYTVKISQGECSDNLAVKVEVKNGNRVAVIDSCNQLYATNKVKITEV